MTRIAYKNFILLLILLSAIILLSCSSGGSNSGNIDSSKTIATINNKPIIVAPVNYPAGTQQSIPVIVQNNSDTPLNNLVYTVSDTTNFTEVPITVDHSNCRLLPAYSAPCTVWAKVPEGSSPGSFTVTAFSYQKSTTNANAINNSATPIFEVNIGLIDLVPNSSTGVDGLTI